VELIVEMLYLEQNVPLCLTARHFLECTLVIVKTVPKRPQGVEPKIALAGELTNFCSGYHGREFLKMINSIFPRVRICI
jgi:hypothetical protein